METLKEGGAGEPANEKASTSCPAMPMSFPSTTQTLAPFSTVAPLHQQQFATAITSRMRTTGQQSQGRHNNWHLQQIWMTSFRQFQFPSILPLLLLFIFIALTASIDARLLDTSVACDQHNFILALNFDAPFHGLVYSEEGFPNCIYVNGTMLSHVNYQLKIPLHGCETRINADGNFENGIIIQENVAFLQATDKKYLLTCIPSTHAPSSSSPSSSSSASSTPSSIATTTAAAFELPAIPAVSFPAPAAAFGRENSVTVDFGGVTVDQSLTSPVSIRGTLPPALSASSAEGGNGGSPVPELKYTVEIRAGHLLESTPINAALNIGDPISYVVRLRKPVSESQIGRCWASDSKSSLELSDEHGCSLQPRGNIWGPFERVDSPEELVFVNRIKAWAFPTSNEVNIFCNLRVCMSRHCSFTTNCSDVAANAIHQNERRRRDGGEFEEIETLKAIIRLRPKRHHNHNANNANGQSQAEYFSLLTYPPAADGNGIFEEAQSLCLSTAQLLLIGACCSVASICLTLASTFLIHSYFCHPQTGQKSMDFQGGHLGGMDNGIWAMVNELKRRQLEREADQKKKALANNNLGNGNCANANGISRHAV